MIKPIDKRILVKPLPKEDKIGILDIPTDLQKRPTKGVVVGVGNEITDIKIGDIAIYEDGLGVDFEHDGEVYRVVERRYVFAYDTIKTK